MANPGLEVYVKFQGHRYATLDFTPPETTTIGSQKGFLEIPKGWAIAPNEKGIVDHVVKKQHWGTIVIVLADGCGYFSAFCTEAQRQRADIGQKHSDNALTYSGSKIGVASVHSRILIRQILNENGNYCGELSKTMWTKKYFTDCKVVCDSVEWHCHRVVLAAASPIFERMLNSSMKEASEKQVNINSTKPEIVQSLLQYAYTGQLDQACNGLSELLCMADCYEMTSLVVLCATAVLSNLDECNVVSTVRVFKSLKDKPVMEGMWASLLDSLNSNKDLLSVALIGL